jgi:hypothetical protein
MNLIRMSLEGERKNDGMDL